MTKIKFAVTSVAAMFLLSSAANAADLYTPEPIPSAASGWYFSGFGGANWSNSTDFDIDAPLAANVVNAYDTGFLAGGAVGYDWGSISGPFGMRLEGEFSYRGNDVKSHNIGGGGPNAVGPALGETNVIAGMANMLFDLNTGSPFMLYGGGGVGVANVDFDGHGVQGVGVVMDDDDTVFAWQLIAGVGFEIMPNMVLDVQYRYFRADDVSLTSATGVTSSTNYESNAVVAGVRWSS